jgi:hypothetical protein
VQSSCSGSACRSRATGRSRAGSTRSTRSCTRRPSGGGRVAFVDTYTLLTGPDGGYAEYLTGDRGTLEKVRRGDGVHLERAGGDIVAAAVLEELERRFELRG